MKMIKKALFVVFLFVAVQSAYSHDLQYVVRQSLETVPLNGIWEEGPWGQANVLELTNYMGERPQHFPKTQAKLLYDSNNLYVFFRVEDNYIVSAAEETDGPVWRDSCVEFFFSPDIERQNTYFNLEINCGGTMYFRFNDINDVKKLIDVGDCEKIEIYHSLPKTVKKEKTEPTTWYLCYRLPLSLISKYGSVIKPQPGVLWKANFYKCADLSSHPHWLTWSPIESPTVNFHLPQYFGVLKFE